MLLFPSVFLSLTVLAFIMLGDVVRDALDPKTALRRRVTCRRSQRERRCRGPRHPGQLAAAVDGLLLEVDDLQVEFRTRDGVAKAINGVSFELARGRDAGHPR